MAKNNEAKIKFSAETGEFNEAIKKSNEEMSKLRAEMKLNETQMKATGETAEGLETKQKLLAEQLSNAQDKTEALSKKLEKAKELYGENSTEANKLEVQVTNAKIAEEKLTQELKQCESALENTAKDADNLADSLGDTERGAKEAGDGFTVMKGVVADLASEAIQAAIGKISEFCGWLADLPEQTRELRQDFATLETSFDNVGFSTETATATWKDLYAVFGEDDRAVETANNISKIAGSQEDLNDWVTITTGVWGTYQDSLPVEGLAEAAQETAKTGTVTGGLADALNWSSEAAVMFADKMEEGETAEDGFNKALAECTTEQERQQLITDTLTALYGDAAETYRDTASAQMEAKEATADNILAENELADTIEPVTTAFTELKTSLLTGLKPAIEAVSNGMLGALEWAKEHPTAMKAIAGAVAVLAVGFTGLAVAVGIYTVAQWAMNSAVLANPITWVVVGIIAAIAALVAIIIVVIDHWELIKNKTAEVWESIKTAVSNGINAVKTTISNIMTAISTFFGNIWNSIKNTVSNAVNGVKSAVSNGFNTAKNTVSNIWNSIRNTISSVWNGIKSGVSSAINGVKTTISNGFNSAKNTVTGIWNAIKNAITKPIEEAKEKVKGVVDAIKGFFGDMKLEFPKIKMPHFSVTGKFSLDPPSVPKLGIEWYKDGGIMMKPTIFGMNGNNLMAGGEAGAEAILPIDKLEGYISNVVERSMGVINLQSLADSIEELANRPVELNINGRQFAMATASDGDNVNGLRSSFRSRGLAIE